MLISVACYQFSPFSLSPQNYKSVVSTAPFIPSVTAGDNYAQEARRGTYFGSSQEASGGSVLQGRRSTIDRGGCTLATGPFWGLFSEPPPGPRHQPWPVKISQNKTLRRVGDLEKEGWKKGRKWEATLDLLSVYPLYSPSYCAQRFSNPSPRTSGQKKMSLFLFLELIFESFVRESQIRMDPENKIHLKHPFSRFCIVSTVEINHISIWWTGVFAFYPIESAPSYIYRCC